MIQKDNFGEFVNLTLGQAPDKAHLFCGYSVSNPFPLSHFVLQPVPCLQLLTKVLYDHLGPAKERKGKCEEAGTACLKVGGQVYPGNMMLYK